MNTTPDEPTLALWLDDELTGPELLRVDAWAASQPDQLAARDEIRQWRSMVASAVPASEEPPFPDFFNSRIQQAIREAPPRPAAAAHARPASIWQSWLMPLAACAGMVLAFWVGTQSEKAPRSVVAMSPSTQGSFEPVVYTPETGVRAEWFASSDASASVIVLDGISAIPDSTDFSKTVHFHGNREIESTADASEKHPTGGLEL